jgi:D-amino peptidase
MKNPRPVRLQVCAGWLAVAGLLCAVPAQAYKVYIFTDMEGCSGVTGGEHISGALKEDGKRLMAEDMNACIAGCFAAGATAVVVRDGHSSGSNVNARVVDARAKLIQGPTPKVRYKELDGAAAVILLGYHAKALTPQAVLAHSYSSASIQGMWLNGREVGEIGVDMAIAAEHKVPVVLVTGDEQAVAEAQTWLPEVGVCATKRGTGPQSAELIPVEQSHRNIQEATAAALRRRAAIPCLKISYPATLRWDYLPAGSLRTHNPDFRPVANPRRVEKTGPSVEQLLLGH